MVVLLRGGVELFRITFSIMENVILKTLNYRRDDFKRQRLDLESFFCQS
jgi:hypothetical protein